jgi:hypothetical protein
MNLGDFHGRETIILANEYFQLECLAEAGPRIVRFIPAWLGENIFAEVPEFVNQTALGEFHYFGGHRLWTAPESLTRTYIPDDHGVTVKKMTNGLKLVGGIEPDTHLRKTLSIQLSPNRPFVMVKHKIENLGRATMRLSPWAVTMLRSKSTAILPQQFGTVDKDGVLPNRSFALWSYSRWEDTRLKLGEEFIRIEANDLSQPFKLGYFNPHGWLGYRFEDVFFVKRFGVRRDEEYPDFGCNSEVYTNDRFIELESLGGLVNLKPHEDVVYTETWEVYETTNIPKELFGEKALEAILKKEL